MKRYLIENINILYGGIILSIYCKGWDFIHQDSRYSSWDSQNLLKKPFKTALRELSVLKNIVVKITTDTGNVGYGEAAITPVITGGIHNALKICDIGEFFGVECMLGCMMESKIGLTAACHFAGGKMIITKFDQSKP